MKLTFCPQQNIEVNSSKFNQNNGYINAINLFQNLFILYPLHQFELTTNVNIITKQIRSKPKTKKSDRTR